MVFCPIAFFILSFLFIYIMTMGTVHILENTGHEIYNDYNNLVIIRIIIISSLNYNLCLT